MRIAFFLLLCINLFSYDFRYSISQKEAKNIFYFLEKFDFKKVLPEDWEIEKKEKSYKIRYFDTDDKKILKQKSICAIKEYGKNKKFVILDNTVFKTKIYRKQKTLKDKHPLFGIIKRKERELFKEKLKKLGVNDPLLLKNIFNLIKLEWQIVILKDNQKLAILSLQKTIFNESPFNKEYFQIFFTISQKDIKEEDLKTLNKISLNIEKEIKSNNKKLKKENCPNNYVCDYEKLKDDFFFRFAVERGLVFYLLYIFALSLIFAAPLLIIKIKKEVTL